MLEQGKVILKVFFFIGLLLVLGTTVYFHNSTKEGFQTAAAPAACRAATTDTSDEGRVGGETEAEAEAYDNYEIYNLDAPPEVQTTPLEPYDSAGQLVEFDLGAEIPWDFDNITQDPRDIVWGTVHPITSQSIFEKAYARKVFQSANNLEYDIEQKAFTYKSPLLNNMEFTDPVMIGFIKYVEFGLELAMEPVIETTLGKGRDGVTRLIRKNAYIDSALKPIDEYRAARQKAADVYTAARNATPPKSIFEASKESRQAFQEIRAQQKGEALKSRPSQPLSATNKASVRGSVKRAMFKQLGEGLSRGASVAKNGLKVTGQVSKKITYDILRKLTPKIIQGILKKFAEVGTRLLVRMLSNMLGAVGVLAWLGPPGWVASAFLLSFTIAMVVIIPSIFSTLIADDAVCPDGFDFNLASAVQGSSTAGPVGWEILSMIPVIGDAMYAFGPYVCTRSDGASALKVPPDTPPYYFDSTLSLFFDSKKGATLSSRPEFLDMKQYIHKRNPSDVRSTDLLPDPPIHVDFSDPIILNKMAQYYYDISRRYAETNYDGSVSFEYITKIYGLIGSSQYSCDIQCELERLTFIPFSGKVLKCEKVPNPILAVDGAQYHDRRFYFYVNTQIGLSIQDRRGWLSSGNTNKFSVLYNDNLVKYTVSGCTHVNGTGIDAIEVSGEGDYVGDAMISLGDPGSRYDAPEFDLSGTAIEAAADGLTGDAAKRKIIETAFPIDQSCNVGRNAMFRYGKTASNPAERGEVENAARNYAVMKKGASEPWSQFSTKMWQVIPTQQSSREFAGTFLQSAFSAAVPLRWPIKGGLAITTLDVVGVSQAVSCMYQDIQNQQGTFIINGFIVSSQGKNMIYRGPTVGYAPGFTPTINKCFSSSSTKLGIKLDDCTSRYSLRRAIKFYHDANPTTHIKRIYDVSVRRKTDRNEIPMCVYNWDEVTYDPATYKEDDATLKNKTIGLVHTIQPNDDTCTYKPAATPKFVEAGGIPLAEYLVAPEGDPVLTVFPTGQGENFRRDTCIGEVNRFQNCADPQIMAHLFSQFNERNENNPQIIYDSTSTIPIRSFTEPGTNGDYPKCIYEVPVRTDVGIGNETIDRKIITMRLVPPRTAISVANIVREAASLNAKQNNGISIAPLANPTQTLLDSCLYDLAYDNYEKGYVYPKVPKEQQWFDVPFPPVPQDTSFVPESCNISQEEKRRYQDCSGEELVSNLVNQFNAKYTDRKITKVFRASTPRIANSKVCDYEIEILRQVPDSSPKSFMNSRESLRMYLKTTTDAAKKCIYDLERDDSVIANSGASLGPIVSAPLLKTPYIWPTKLIDQARQSVNRAISDFRGYDIKGTLKTVSLQSKNITDKVLQDVLASKFLDGCGPLTDPANPNFRLVEPKNCRNIETLQAIVNRYNLLGLPPYPGKQYGVERRRITEIRRGGVSGGKSCQIELIEVIDIFEDFILKPLNITDFTQAGALDNVNLNAKTFLRKYEFPMTMANGISCDSYAIDKSLFGKTELEKGVMDISQNAIALMSDLTKITIGDCEMKPSPCINYDMKIDGSASVVRTAVKQIYESILIGTDSKTKTPLYNSVVNFTNWFSPRPNVVEYRAQVIHQLYDSLFRKWFTKSDETILRATWPEGSHYTIETGNIVSSGNVPATVEEFFSPDIEWKNTSGDTWVAIHTKTNKDITNELPYMYLWDPEVTPIRDTRIVAI